MTNDNALCIYCEFFLVEVVALSSYEEKEEQFKEQVRPLVDYFDCLFISSTKCDDFLFA